jgi:hypothetical protein
VTIRRVSSSELKKVGRPGARVEAGVPARIGGVLGPFWNFVRRTIQRFNRELTNDHSKEFEKAVVNKFK